MCSEHKVLNKFNTLELQQYNFFAVKKDSKEKIEMYFNDWGENVEVNKDIRFNFIEILDNIKTDFISHIYDINKISYYVRYYYRLLVILYLYKAVYIIKINSEFDFKFVNKNN